MIQFLKKTFIILLFSVNSTKEQMNIIDDKKQNVNFSNICEDSINNDFFNSEIEKMKEMKIRHLTEEKCLKIKNQLLNNLSLYSMETKEIYEKYFKFDCMEKEI